MQRLHLRNTVQFVFSPQNPRANRGRLQSTRSLGRAIKYLRLRYVHHHMWRRKLFCRLERTQTLGRVNSKSLAMTSDSEGGVIRGSEAR